MFRLQLLLALWLLVPAIAYPIDVLVPGHLHCPFEADLIELASITNHDKSVNAIALKLDEIRCASVPFGVPVKDVHRKFTANGGAYFCYRVDSKVAAPSNEECATYPDLMSLEQYLDSRPDNYEITADGNVALIAKCVDGATVILEKHPGHFLRTVLLPFVGLDNAQPTRVESEADSAIRGGCHGEDYRNNGDY